MAVRGRIGEGRARRFASRPTGRPAGLVGLVGLVGVMGATVLAGCSSGRSTTAITPVTGSGSLSLPTITAPLTSVTQGDVVPTVFNCGGGAYKPATLLVTCGDVATTDVTTVMGTQWTAWTATGASGTGTVSAKVDGKKVQGPAQVALGTVVTTENGPQYSSLLVTWTGSSPDGHATDRFAVATARH